MYEETNETISTARDGSRVRFATRADLTGVLAVQRDAFTRVARMHGIDPDRLSPLQETMADLELLMEQGVVFFVAVDPEDAIAGTVRATLSGPTVEIGRLAVGSGHLRLGIASALMEALESSFPQAGRFELFTGAGAAVPLALYEGRGYRVFKEETAEGPVRLVWLEKNAGGACGAVYTDAHD